MGAKTAHKFEAGDRVLLDGEEVTVARVGININKRPIYKIGEQWYQESELKEWFPPCPL